MRLAEIAIVFDGPQLDRPLTLEIGSDRDGHQRQDALAHLRLRRQFLRSGDLRHFELMAEAGLVALKGYRHEEDGVPVLNGDDPPGGEALAVADAVHLIDDRHFRIAGEQEVGMQRMRRPLIDLLDGATGGDQGLSDHLAAEHALPARLWGAAPKQIHFQRLEIEDLEHVLNG
jgi:hypothetical protein